MDQLAKKIRDAIRAEREEMTRFIEELIAIPTENPPGRNYGACAQFIGNTLRYLGLDASMEEILPPAANAESPKNGTEPRYWMRCFYGQGSRTLYFHGHYDVVPAARADQFQPRRNGTNLFGRGSADMKSGLAAMVFAVVAIKQLALPLNGRIGLIFVPDEETGGARGSAQLAGRTDWAEGAIGMLTPEPTGGVVWNACRGALSMRVTTKGKPAHVGLSCTGVNAFERMLAVAEALKEEKRKIERRRTKFHIKPEAARNSILMLGGECRGGTNFNLVPEQCSFTIDRRTNPEEDLAHEKASLLGILEKMRRDGNECAVEILQEGQAAATEEDDTLAQALKASARAVTGRAPRFEMCPGLLETRFYAARGIPALAYGPGLLTVAHGPNEYVSLDKVEECAATYALTAARLLGTADAD